MYSEKVVFFLECIPKKLYFCKKIYVMIERALKKIIQESQRTRKAIIIMGSRQVGKTTLLKQLFPENDKCIWFYGDDFGSACIC